MMEYILQKINDYGLPYDDMIVHIRYKYDFESVYQEANELLLFDPCYDHYYCWYNDWYEGQQDIQFLEFIPISKINDYSRWYKL